VAIVFTNSKYPFIHKLGYHTKDHIKGNMTFVQVVEREPAYQKQNGYENLVLTSRVTSEVTSYQATWYANLHPLKN
jgi:hypothetical protein